MKKLFYISIVLLCTLTFQAQNINNGGFENWSGNTINTWATLNVIDTSINRLYSKETFRTEGDYSIGMITDTITIPSIAPTPLLINPGIIYGTLTYSTTSGLVSQGLPFAFRPDSIAFDANFQPVGNDTAIFLMYLSKNYFIIGGLGPTANSYGFINNTGGNWFSASVPITYLNSDTPDSVLIMVQSGLNAPQFGTKLMVDNFRFIYKTNTGIYEEYISSKLVKCYPNPTTEYINIELESDIQNSLLELYDVSGNRIYTQELNSLNTIIDVKSYSNGAYSYRVIKDHKIYSGHFIVNK